VEFVIDEMKVAYPDLVDKKVFLSKRCRQRKSSFFEPWNEVWRCWMKK
jgi:hypothetical protein